MKLRLYIGGLIAFSVLFSSCGKDSEEGESFEPHTYNVSGKVEKGPFVSGSTITIQPMDSKLQVRGDFYSSTIQDDMGNFSFGSKLFEAPYAELTANGYFFNEVEGELSSGTLSLRALVDLSDKTTVNVNVLTHLKYQRVQKLVEGGMSFKEANTQAQKELFTAFGLQKYEDKDASSLSIIGGTDESAALIAISSLLIVDRSEAALTEYLAKLCKEFGDNGAFTESTRQQMEEDRNALAGQLSAVRNHVIDRYEEIGLPIEVKELAYFFDWDNDGVAGNETLQEGQTVTLETTELQVPNQGGNYTIKITSPVPVYLEPLISEDDESYPPLISDDYFSTNIYEGLADASVSLEKSLENNVLTINVSPLNSRTSKEASVKVYDCMGNEVGEVKIVQEGNPDMPLPKLGETGKTVVAGFALELAKAFPSLVPLMTYTDVLLSYAECLCKNGRTSDAEIQLNKLVTAKELQLSGVTVLDKIKSARLQLTLYCDVNFAFLKRTGLAKEVYGVENYRLLLPIPQRDVIAGGISQNTGY